MRLPVLPSIIAGFIVLAGKDPVSAFVSLHRQEGALRLLLSSSPWSEHEPRGPDRERATHPAFRSHDACRCPWRTRRRTSRRGTRIFSSQRPGGDHHAPALSMSSETSSSTTSGDDTVLTAKRHSVAVVPSSHSSAMAARAVPTTTEASEAKSDDRRGTPLARFNNLVNYGRYDADVNHDVVDASAHLDANSNGRDHHRLVNSETERPSAGLTSESSAPLMVNFLDLMHMAFRSATTVEMQRKRRDFVRQLKRRGGYCVVEMDRDDVEARILHEMWDLMDRVVVPSAAEGESSSTMLRRQVLKRTTESSSSNSTTPYDNPGYDFVQTTLVDGSLRPVWIEERHGPHASEHAAKAYMLLAQLCKAFATVVYAGSSVVSPENATQLMESLLDDPGRSFAGSYHRLCRYLPLPPRRQNGRDEWGESLRPHVDWTISTAIPVSSVAGLEVYEPSKSQPPSEQHEAYRRWIRIEEVMGDDWRRKSAGRSATSDGTRCGWNAHYVVVFAGAWLELLTDGDVEATLHRVVSRRDDATAAGASVQSSTSQQRLSAPFFMRPKEVVFARTDQVFDDPHDESVAQLDSTEAVRAMGRFLRESKFRQV